VAGGGPIVVAGAGARLAIEAEATLRGCTMGRRRFRRSMMAQVVDVSILGVVVGFLSEDEEEADDEEVGRQAALETLMILPFTSTEDRRRLRTRLSEETSLSATIIASTECSNSEGTLCRLILRRLGAKARFVPTRLFLNRRGDHHLHGELSAAWIQRAHLWEVGARRLSLSTTLVSKKVIVGVLLVVPRGLGSRELYILRRVRCRETSRLLRKINNTLERIRQIDSRIKQSNAVAMVSLGAILLATRTLRCPKKNRAVLRRL